MRVKVIRAFVDKKTGRGYNEGETYEADATRAAELHKAGFTTKPPATKRTRAKAVKNDESDK